MVDSVIFYFFFSVYVFDKWCLLVFLLEKEEFKLVFLDVREDYFVKDLVGEELEIIYLNEIWDYFWFKMMEF